MASGLELTWIYYGQEMPKSPQGEQPEMDKASDGIYFPLCAREEDPLTTSPQLPSLLSLSLSRCLANGKNGRRSD
jgi:hypothetical protein